MSNETSAVRGQVQTLMARVFALVQECPAGRVTTYGWLAKAAGYPRGARMVGWIMNETPKGIPAQRVINSKGELSGGWAFGGEDKMQQLLEAEGIIFSAEGRVDLKRYGWDPNRDLDAETLSNIMNMSDTDIKDKADHEPSPKLLGLMQNDSASPFKPA